ncbi:hypothetical protein ACSQ67_009081 [Phaseolus vulgaris]
MANAAAVAAQDPVTMPQYFIGGTLPRAYHWVPVNGISPRDAVSHIEVFIKSALYQIECNPPKNMTAENRRLKAVVIGAMRAAITTMYEITLPDLSANETAPPVICVVTAPAAPPPVNEEPVPPVANGVSYRVMIPSGANKRECLTTALVLDDKERELVRMCIGVAPAVVPLHGLNLMTDAHHYLPDGTKPSFRSFFAVEKQVWVTPEIKKITDAGLDELRDSAWHKAGHPIVNSLKYMMATDPDITKKLKNANLGSAAASLPAMEPEVKAANSYLKVCNEVKLTWEYMSWSINTEEMVWWMDQLRKFKKGAVALTDAEAIPVKGSLGLYLRERKDVLDGLNAVLRRSAETVAVALGFYEGMLDSVFAVSNHTLANAHSLKKLRSEYRGKYFWGGELFRHYKAYRNNQREKGPTIL